MEAKYVCASCGIRATKRCGGCEQVRYCNQACLTQHFPEHKLVCRALKVGAEKAAAAATEAGKAEADKAEAGGKAPVKGGKVKGGKASGPVEEHGNCWTCGTDNPPLKCGACRVAKYCGGACQKENWSIHKGRCADLKRATTDFDWAKDELRLVKSGSRRSQAQLDEDLRNASMLGRISDMESVIAAGGNVNSPDPQQHFSPLHHAAQEGHVRAIGVLVRHGARVDGRSNTGLTALHQAVHPGQLKAVAALLEHGSSVNSRTNRGQVSLYYASDYNHLEVVALLLENGAHIDSICDNGLSPLYAASKNNYPEIVALPLGKGAQVDLPTKTGATSL